MAVGDMPGFVPHPLLRGGHRQTLAGMFLTGERTAYQARQQRVPLPDGDRLVLHDDTPPGWQPGECVALLIHGLAGCHGSPYLVRIAHKLNQRGVRSFRMDLRGCGAGLKLARYPYHSGRSEDAAAALAAIAELCPGSPVAIIGFSLGGNIALKLLGETAAGRPVNLDRAVAVGPPVDLLACVEWFRRPAGRLYDRYFARLLWRRMLQRQRLVPEAASADVRRAPQGLREFDSLFTAPVCGFGTAENYYRQSSALPLLPRIQVPTWILASRDDPMVPCGPLEDARLSASTRLCLTEWGGHLGFYGRRNGDADRHWMDWRIVEWVTGGVG